MMENNTFQYRIAGNGQNNIAVLNRTEINPTNTILSKELSCEKVEKSKLSI